MAGRASERPRGSGALLRLAARAASLPLERAQPPRGVIDAIVVVGAPLTADHQLTAVLEERLVHSVRAWHLFGARLFCVSGGGRAEIAEADALGARALALGIPEAALRIERGSRTTAENARLSRALLAPEGVRSVCVVTQRFHLRRTSYLFARAGFEVCGYRIEGGLQTEEPRRALRWMTREYAAWARLLVSGRAR